MRTPSIGRRFVGAGVVVVAALALAFDLLMFLAVRASMTVGTETLFAPRQSVPVTDPRLMRLLLFEALITPLVVALAALLLRWIAEIATRPLDEIASRARLTTLGLWGERLHPDRPHTRIGQMATAYDNMLDSLEGAVAESQAARAECEQANAHLAAIVASSDQAILSTDPSGVVLSWNRAAERIYGYAAAEAVGQRLRALISPDEVVPPTDSALDAVARGEVVQRDDAIRRRKDGSLVHVSVTVAPLRDASGEIYGACVVAQDITEARRMASQLETSLSALATAAEEAVESETRTRRFLDDAAHQLRSPITSIRACADTLALGVTPAQRDRLVAAVCRESGRAGRLMAGLLRMARLGHEQAQELQPCDLLVLCEAEAERARLNSPHLAVTATSVGPPLGWARLAADAVGEILANLVDNASRHARSRIDIRVQARDYGVEVRVVDDGPGVAHGQSENVFERFVSLDNQGGSGLGLAIARELARTQGGDLTYEGRAFVLRLPCESEPVESCGPQRLREDSLDVLDVTVASPGF